MTSHKPKVLIAISGVLFGLTLFITLMIWTTRTLQISNLHHLIRFMPRWIIIWVGTANVATFLPIFFAGVFFLKPRGAVGRSPHLVRNGIYKYLRNPFYSGLSFTLIGLGLLSGKTALFLAGLIWLLICYVQVKREEKELALRFGGEYEAYKSDTPAFIPRFDSMIHDLIRPQV